MKKSTPAPLAAAVTDALTPEVVPASEPLSINVDGDATNLVRQAIGDHINAQSPAVRAASKSVFDQFMDRCVVLAK